MDFKIVAIQSDDTTTVEYTHKIKLKLVGIDSEASGQVPFGLLQNEVKNEEC